MTVYDLNTTARLQHASPLHKVRRSERIDALVLSEITYPPRFRIGWHLHELAAFALPPARRSRRCDLTKAHPAFCSGQPESAIGIRSGTAGRSVSGSRSARPG
jgi:hypothetical protein